jgi:hypothetical protein
MNPGSKYAPADLQLQDKREKIRNSFREKLNSFSQDFEEALDSITIDYHFDHKSQNFGAKEIAGLDEK